MDAITPPMESRPDNRSTTANSKERFRCFFDIIDYNEDVFKKQRFADDDVSNLKALSDVPDGCVRWMNVDGDCSEELLMDIGKAFHIHPLVLKNILNDNQRAMIEGYRNYLYIVTKMAWFSGADFVIGRMNLILGKNYVITFCEKSNDVFQVIRHRLSSNGSNVREYGADYLLYLMLDAIVEDYFDVLERIEDQIDDLEEKVMESTDQAHLIQIQDVKKNLIRLHKQIWPVRDITSVIGKESAGLILPDTEPYFRDVYNHAVQAIDSTETCRDLLSELVDTHMNNTSYRLNEIMKVLTIISTIFIPLSFIVGVYGMNFQFMPELTWRWGYLVVLGIMLLIALVMIYYFKRKKWF